MSKALFIPFGVTGGLLAGLLSKKLFRSAWGLLDSEQAPNPKQRAINVRKLALALLLEGAIFRAVRGLVDHGARRSFRALTGAWPGEEGPTPQ